MRFVLFLMMAVFVGSTIAQADDESSGCGLGWAVTKRYSLVSSSIRSTTNAVASSTFGMTSGTSGCDKHSIVKNDKRGLHYAEANYQSLMVEMAEGHGEYLDTFASVLGCSPAMYRNFSEATRTRYSEIFDESASPGKVLNRVKAVLKANPQLAAGCNISA